jgi:hypothetical protein
MRMLGAPLRATIGDGSVAATDLATKSIRVIVNSTRSAKSAVTFTDTAISAIFILRNKST